VRGKTPARDEGFRDSGEYNDSCQEAFGGGPEQQRGPGEENESVGVFFSLPSKFDGTLKKSQVKGKRGK